MPLTRFRYLLLSAFMLTTVGLNPPASSLTVMDLSEAQVEQVAELIAVGEVIDVQVQGTGTSLWRFETRVLFFVWHVDKGVSISLLEFYLPGGSRNGITTWVPGAPRVSKGDTLKLLLRERHGRWLPVGISLGVIPLVPSDGRPAFHGGVLR